MDQTAVKAWAEKQIKSGHDPVKLDAMLGQKYPGVTLKSLGVETAPAVPFTPDIPAASPEQAAASAEENRKQALANEFDKKSLLGKVGHVIGNAPEQIAAGLGVNLPAYLADLATGGDAAKQHVADEATKMGPVADTLQGISSLFTPMPVGKGGLAKRMLVSGAEGAGIGATNAITHGGDPISGGLIGTLTGLGGRAIGEATQAGGRTIGNRGRTPEEMATKRLQPLIDANPNAQAQIDALGPDAIVGDALGKGGRDMIKQITRADPLAANKMTDATLPRSTRFDTALEDKITAVRDQHRPGINEAYQKAYKEGGDIPYANVHVGKDKYMEVPAPFKDILKNGSALEAYKVAVPTVEDFTKSGNPGGPLAEIDMTIRELRGWANNAKNGREPNPTQASRYSQLADTLQKKADEVMGTPAYADARKAHAAMADQEKAVTAQHLIDKKVMSGTAGAISKQAPSSGFGLNETAASAALGAGLGALEFIPGAHGLTALMASAAPAVSQLLSHIERNNLEKIASEMADILSSKTIPAAVKAGRVEKLLTGKGSERAISGLTSALTQYATRGPR